jgi:hypothetical protein
MLGRCNLPTYRFMVKKGQHINANFVLKKYDLYAASETFYISILTN